jgi:hypothetical protein
MADPPRGTVAYDIEQWAEPGADHYIRAGTLGTLGPLRWWRVQGTQTKGDRAGSSSSWPAVNSVEEARAQLAELRADPANRRYDTWEIVLMESMIRTSLVPLEPAPAPVLAGHAFTVTSGPGGTGWHCSTCVWTGVDVGSEAAARQEHARVAADIASGRLAPAPAEETTRG